MNAQYRVRSDRSETRPRPSWTIEVAPCAGALMISIATRKRQEASYDQNR